MHNRLYKMKHRARQTAISLNPVSAVKFRKHKKTIVHIAETLGFVYFGFVDQREDEHKLVRGLTLSPTHRDNHYCIGSFNGYDMVLLERSDIVSTPGKPDRAVTWFIVETDLRTTYDMPHVFLGSHSHSDTFYAHLFARFNKLIKAEFGVFGAHSKDFVNHYSVYTEPAKVIEAEQIFTVDITDKIAKHFRPLDIELNHDNLYVYAENQDMTAHLIDTMIKNSLWLAKQLDTRVQDINKNNP